MNLAKLRRPGGFAAALALVLLSLGAGAQGPDGDGPPSGQNGGRRGPPPQAYEACEGQAEEASCSFPTPNGSQSGSCLTMEDGRMSCIPSWAPRPPSARRAAAPPAAVPLAIPSSVVIPSDLAPAPAPAPVAAVVPAPVPIPVPVVVAAPAAAPAAPPPAEPTSGVPFAAGFAAAVVGAAALFAIMRSRAPSTEAAIPSAPSEPAKRTPSFAELAEGPTLVAPVPPPVMPSGFTQRPLGPNGGLLIGKNFETRREVGAGGMGVVFEATDLALDRRVALKKMRPEIGRNARGRERFLEEAKLVAKLSHPNIVGIHAIIEEAGDLYLVFEYVDGETLDDVLARRKKLTPTEAMKVLGEVADAVDYAHTQRVIHRDLKPSNIMIDRNGRAKVMDFGIAHQAKITISQLTVAEAFGTLAYMPPEQELGKAVRESDVYAFAAVTYETLTGGLPFPGPNFHLQKIEMAFQRPSASALPAGFEAVFECALQAEPKKRYRTSGEFVRTLQGALAA
jgi:tRNA A-37 threonylcarbamoyl transferase component Bud32